MPELGRHCPNWGSRRGESYPFFRSIIYNFGFGPKPAYPWTVIEKKKQKVAIVLPVAFWLAWSLFAQTDSEDSKPLFSTETDLVSLDVTVTDRKGRPVGDLTKQDFIVYEDGKQQNIAFFSHDQRPASWGLVLDRSGSMTDMIEDVYKAALHSIESGTPEDEIFAMTFNDSLELVQPFTSDRLAVLTSIRDLRARGQTALYDAGAFALDYMKGARHKKRVLVIVTDGEDNASSISFNKFLNMARKSETIIYTVGFFDFMDAFFGFGLSSPRQQLKRLAEQTGGMAYFPKNMEECISAHRDIALQVSRQYSLGYYPSNTDWDERWREIKVEVLRSGSLVARSRKSYFAPKTQR